MKLIVAMALMIAPLLAVDNDSVRKLGASSETKSQALKVVATTGVKAEAWPDEPWFSVGWDKLDSAGNVIQAAAEPVPANLPVVAAVVAAKAVKTATHLRGAVGPARLQRQ